jgi:endonuclease/exonuclease/phosphatase family metal-dependent hydrolase
MKRIFPMLMFALIFLLFIQAAGTLVESIYILDLMHSNLDAQVLGVLFFFTPLLLLPFFNKFRTQSIWAACALLVVGRGLFPYVNTANRMLAAGIATGAALSLIFLLLSAKARGEQPAAPGISWSAGLALALSLSVLLRTLYFGLDYSLTRAGGWSGIVLGFLLAGLLTQLDPSSQPDPDKKTGAVTAPILGLFMVLTLVYFAFSAPAVIARWTESNYTLIVTTVSLLACACVLLFLLRPQFLQRIRPSLLLVWNLAFTICLTGTLLAHSVPFPLTPNSPSVLVGPPAAWQALPLAGMLLLFPVLFFDLGLFIQKIGQAAPAPRQLVPGILLGCLALILLVFANIFSNVWGYVKPVSLFFRGKYWLAFLLPAAALCWLSWQARKSAPDPEKAGPGKYSLSLAILLGCIFIVTVVRALPGKRIQVDPAKKTSLLAMTFNIQEANDVSAEPSFERQLALIKKVSPDILSLQETDSTRISLNNNDYVRFYAENLGYYSYYGPTTVTGTYGTAILSKFPLLNTRTVFTYSDKDEIGVAEAEIEVAGKRFNIYDVHPDGSDTAMLVFAQALLERSNANTYVISLGDYNLRDYEDAYKLINSVYTNAWTSVYPSKISPDGVDMSGENRIDHIFLSSSLQARNPVYLLPPASATDHAVHWSEIVWGNP